MYVCSCRGVTDSQVKDAVGAGASSVDEVARACGAGGNCGGCLDLLARLLAAAEAAVNRETAAFL